MKKIFGFMGVAALLTLGSCANDNFDGPEAPAQQKGDMFMTMNITQITPAGTRTATEQQGVEIGQDYENNVSSALVIFAKKGNDNIYKIFKHYPVGQSAIVGGNGNYAATFEATRSDFLNDVNNGSAEYAIFVIGNPTRTMVEGCVDDTPVQNVFTLEADADTYWDKTNQSFLMSSAGTINEETTEPNAGINVRTITADEIALGTCTTPGTALNLGVVRIQRAMSRFDLEVDDMYTIFDAAGQNENDQQAGTQVNQGSDLKNIRIIIDGVALVNQATEANLFKVTGSSSLEFAKNQTLNFTMEKNVAEGVNANWVWTPVQTKFSLPMFADDDQGQTITGAATAGRLAGKKIDVSTLNFTSITEIKGHDEDNTYTHPNDQTPSQLGAYRIWRYCMENTNPNTRDNQVNGNSTGIVIRAKIESDTIVKYKGENAPIYAFANTFIGDITRLRNFAVNKKAENDQSGVYEMVNIRFHAAVDAYNKTQTNDADKFVYGDAEKDTPATEPEGQPTPPVGKKLSTASAEQLAVLNPFLVAQEFSIYRANEDGNYYCYYTYWNRHNDNGKNTEMGVMEFGTVRNNVYKIRFEKIHRLGHPGNPDDDPDPEKPGDPDESDHFYISVACEILPWEVRMNGVEL